MDAEVTGITGSRLSFAYSGAAYSVGTDGSIAREGQAPRAGVPLREPACHAAAYFGGSAYAACWRHQDLATGRQRLLVYEGACT